MLYMGSTSIWSFFKTYLMNFFPSCKILRFIPSAEFSNCNMCYNGHDLILSCLDFNKWSSIKGLIIGFHL